MWRVIAVIATLAATARADPTASARQHGAELFAQGRDLAKLGRFAEAYAVFTRSDQLDPEPGTELNLGDCQEHLGHLADAWRWYQAAANGFEQEGEASRAAFARERASTIAPRLATIVIELVDSAGATITIAGRDVPAAPEIRERVDPGVIEVHVAAAGRPAVTRTERVGAGDTRVIDLSPPPAPRLAAPPPRDLEPRRRRGRVVAAWTLGGTGVAALALGGVIAVEARNAYQAQLDNGNCSTASGKLVCNSTGYSATSAADDRADLGTGFVIAGAALVVTGAIVYFTAPRDVAVVPSATGSSLGLAVAGRF